MVTLRFRNRNRDSHLKHIFQNEQKISRSCLHLVPAETIHKVAL